MSKLQPGTQITYVPGHADGPDHPNAEDGFVTRVNDEGDVAWCRFWSKHHDGLRTTATSEACFTRDLVVRDTRPQAEIDAKLEELGYHEEDACT